MARVKNKPANAQFRSAALRLRRRPVGLTSALDRAERNRQRLGGTDAGRRLSSAADRLENRPTGLTSAINRARANADAARRRRMR